jgi:hypothetical protein
MRKTPRVAVPVAAADELAVVAAGAAGTQAANALVPAATPTACKKWRRLKRLLVCIALFLCVVESLACWLLHLRQRAKAYPTNICNSLSLP